MRQWRLLTPGWPSLSGSEQPQDCRGFLLSNTPVRDRPRACLVPCGSKQAFATAHPLHLEHKRAVGGVQADNHGDLRLAALTQLYNVVVDAPLQFRVLLRTLAFAKAANLAGMLAPVVKARCKLMCQVLVLYLISVICRSGVKSALPRAWKPCAGLTDRRTASPCACK